MRWLLTARDKSNTLLFYKGRHRGTGAPWFDEFYAGARVFHPLDLADETQEFLDQVGDMFPDAMFIPYRPWWKYVFIGQRAAQIPGTDLHEMGEVFAYV
jgi:hypothetical protein